MTSAGGGRCAHHLKLVFFIFLFQYFLLFYCFMSHTLTPVSDPCFIPEKKIHKEKNWVTILSLHKQWRAAVFKNVGGGKPARSGWCRGRKK